MYSEELCSKIVKQIEREERQYLHKLYRLPLTSLEKKERNELIRYAIELPLIAQRVVKEEFQNVGMPYVHTAWKKIDEKLPPISYTYIDWNQMHDLQSKALKDKAKNNRLVKAIHNKMSPGSAELNSSLNKREDSLPLS